MHFDPLRPMGKSEQLFKPCCISILDAFKAGQKLNTVKKIAEYMGDGLQKPENKKSVWYFYSIFLTISYPPIVKARLI